MVCIVSDCKYCFQTFWRRINNTLVESNKKHVTWRKFWWLIQNKWVNDLKVATSVLLLYLIRILNLIWKYILIHFLQKNVNPWSARESGISLRVINRLTSSYFCLNRINIDLYWSLNSSLISVLLRARWYIEPIKGLDITLEQFLLIRPDSASIALHLT